MGTRVKPCSYKVQYTSRLDILALLTEGKSHLVFNAYDMPQQTIYFLRSGSSASTINTLAHSLSVQTFTVLLLIIDTIFIAIVLVCRC